MDKMDNLNQVTGGNISGGGQYYIDPDNCVNCAQCQGICPVDAVEFDGNTYHINQAACCSCESCMYVCPTGAVHNG